MLKTERYENDLFNFKSYVIQLKSRGKCIAPEENVSTPEKLKIARPMIQIKAFWRNQTMDRIRREPSINETESKGTIK